MPALAELALIAFGTGVDIAADVGTGHHSIWHALCGSGSFSISRVLAPGMTLLLGAAPFLSWREPIGVRRAT